MKRRAHMVGMVGLAASVLVLFMPAGAWAGPQEELDAAEKLATEKKTEEAITAFGKVADNESAPAPLRVRALSRMADLYQPRGVAGYEDTARACARAVELEEKPEANLELRLRAKTFYGYLGKPQEAWAVLEPVAKDESAPRPLRVRAWQNMAEVASARGAAGYDDAITAYLRAVELEEKPESRVILQLALAGVYATANKPPEAQAIWESVAKQRDVGNGQHAARAEWGFRGRVGLPGSHLLILNCACVSIRNLLAWPQHGPTHSYRPRWRLVSRHRPRQ